MTDDANMVVMQDGSKLKFGNRISIKVQQDIENNKIIWAFKDGTLREWPVQNVEGLTEFQKTAVFYGIISRIQNAYGPIKELEAIKEVIEKLIVEIDSGVFNIRGNVGPDEDLTPTQKAWAILASRAKPEEFGHWTNFDDKKVVEEILLRWSVLDKAQLSAIRKNKAVQFEIAKMRVKGKDDVNVESLGF